MNIINQENMRELPKRTASNIRKAEAEDLNEILNNIAVARGYMHSHGNTTQWASDYPSKDDVMERIESREMYVGEINGQVHFSFVFFIGEDPFYNRIDNGQWLNNKPYGAIHMIASNGKSHGVLEQIVDYCSLKTSNLKIDTHANNEIMNRKLKALGFCFCGIVYVQGGAPRNAYQKTSTLAERPKKRIRSDAAASPDRPRCKWANPGNPLYLCYHDNEWGVPCHDEQAQYELFILESFQAGLSWETILNKRENFRSAYDHFDINKVCDYGKEKVELLMNDKGIVRNRRKIEASINNSRIFREIRNEYGSWDAYIHTFASGNIIYEDDPTVTTSPLSDAISKDLKKRGMHFVGPTIIHSYLQAIGVINAHMKGCWKHFQGSFT